MNNSNSASHKSTTTTTTTTSNAANSRLSHHKTMKLAMPLPLPPPFQQQPPVISVNAKDSHKDNNVKERKMKSPMPIKLKQQQSSKRVEIKEPSRATAGSIKIQNVERHCAASRQTEPQQQQQQSQQQLQTQMHHLKHSRKMKDDATTSKSKDLRAAVVEGFATTTKAHKERKSPEKGDAPHRPVRTKAQTQNTKIFFDKYLKFAYDLSTPTGVRELEEHFFPTNSNAMMRDPQRSKVNPHVKGDSGEKPKASEDLE